MTVRSIWAPLGIASATVGFLSPALASDAITRVSLRYEVAAGCPDDTAFRGQVRARTNRMTWVPSGAERRFSASVTSRGGEFIGQLQVEANDGTVSSRQVSGKTCDEVVAALALISALAVDPNASASLDSTEVPIANGSSPPSQAGKAGGDEAAPLPARSSSDSSLSTVGPSLPLEDRPPVSNAPRSESPRWQLGLGGGAGVATGVLPSAAWIASLFVEATTVRTRGFAPSVRLSVNGSTLQSYEVSHGKAQYQWFFGTLDSCPVRIAIGNGTQVRACGFAEAGVLLADATGFDHPEAPSRRGWGALGVLGRIQWSAGPWWFEGTAGPRIALTRLTYWVDLPERVPVHHVALVGLAATASLGFLLP